MRNDGTELERLADAITLLKRAPHTAGELGKKLDVQANTARRWCSVWSDKGHVTAKYTMVRGNLAKSWEWV